MLWGCCVARVVIVAGSKVDGSGEVVPAMGTVGLVAMGLLKTARGSLSAVSPPCIDPGLSSGV